MSKFTPGPWNVKPHGVICGGIVRKYVNGSGQDQLAMASVVDMDNQGSQEANANLIAAAPDLLSALERIARNFELLLAQKPVRDVSETLAEVNAAIVKATGEK